MRLNMVMGGGSVDSDELTLTPDKALEDELFYGYGSDDAQVGCMPDMSKKRESPGISTDDPDIPVHPGSSPQYHVDTNGTNRLCILPPKGFFPGNRAFVGIPVDDIGIIPDCIPVNKSIGNVKGTYGADGDLTGADLLVSRVGYGAKGKVSGEMPNNGSPAKTLKAGESYGIAKGYYSGGKITAADLASQTKDAILDPAFLVEGYSGYDDGVLKKGTMKNQGGHQNSKNCYLYQHTDGNIYLINWMPGGRYEGWQKASDGTLCAEVWTPQSTLASGIGLSAPMLSKGHSLLGINGTANRSVIVNYTAYDGDINFTGYSNTAGDRTITLGNLYYDWDTIAIQVKAVTGSEGPVTICLSKGKSMRVPVTTIKYNNAPYLNAWLSIARSAAGTLTIAPFRGNVSGTYRVIVQIFAVFDGIVNSEA